MNKPMVAVVAAVAGVIVLLIGGAIWAFRGGEDPDVKRIKEMQAEISFENTPPEQIREKMQEVRKEVEKLVPKQQQEVGRQMGEMFLKKVTDHTAEYFRLSPEQQVAMLDKDIDLIEQFRKMFQSAGPRGGAGGPGGAGGGSGGPAGAASGQGNPGAQGGPGGPKRSLDGRNAWRKKMLDLTTPEQRAQMGSYIEDLNKRRAARGMPPFTPPFGGFMGR